METRPRGVPDYSKFLKKLWYTSKQHFNPTLTAEALSIVNEAYIELKNQDNKISLRVHNLLLNLTKARARLLFKKIADSEDAKAMVEYYSKTIKDYQTGTIEPKDPIEIGIKECKKYLCESVGEETFEYTETELLKKACESNPQVDKYIKSGVLKRIGLIRATTNVRDIFYERLRLGIQRLTVTYKKPHTEMDSPKNQQNQTPF